MKLTGRTITDSQIRDLGAQLTSEGKYSTAMWCDYALIPAREQKRYDVPRGCDRRTARARCADLINARLEQRS